MTHLHGRKHTHRLWHNCVRASSRCDGVKIEIWGLQLEENSSLISDWQQERERYKQQYESSSLGSMLTLTLCLRIRCSFLLSTGGRLIVIECSQEKYNEWTIIIRRASNSRTMVSFTIYIYINYYLLSANWIMFAWRRIIIMHWWQCSLLFKHHNAITISDEWLLIF